MLLQKVGGRFALAPYVTPFSSLPSFPSLRSPRPSFAFPFVLPPLPTNERSFHFPPSPFSQRTAYKLENDPQQIGAVANAAEVAKAAEQRESAAGFGGAQGGGRRLLPVEGDRDGGAESDRLPADLAGEVRRRAVAEGHESDVVGGVVGGCRGAEEDGALGVAAVVALGVVQGSISVVVEDGKGRRVLAEDHLGERERGIGAREVVQRGQPAISEEAHQGSRAAALPAPLDDQQEEGSGLLGRQEKESEQMEHSPAESTLVRQLPAGVGREEGLQVGDGGDESGGSLGRAAVPRRVEDVEESGVGHEPCKRERAVEHGAGEGASEWTGGAWREARV